MRYDSRYTRVLSIITDEAVPRLPNGGVALCKWCQRKITFAGGLIEHLIRTVERLALRHGYYKSGRSNHA